MMKNVIFDRDGIINEVVIRNGIPSSPWKKKEFHFRDEIFEVVDKIHLQGCQIFVASNQPDISRGNLLESDLNYFNELISSRLKIPSKNIYVCKHDNHHKCECRKPKPGMLKQILSDFNLRIEETCFVGDSFKDLEAANSIGMNFFYLRTCYNDNPKNNVKMISNLKDLQF